MGTPCTIVTNAIVMRIILVEHSHVGTGCSMANWVGYGLYGAIGTGPTTLLTTGGLIWWRLFLLTARQPAITQMQQIGRQQQATATLTPATMIFTVVEKSPKKKKRDDGPPMLKQCSSSLLSPQLSNPSHSCCSGMQRALPHTKMPG